MSHHKCFEKIKKNLKFEVLEFFNLELRKKLIKHRNKEILRCVKYYIEILINNRIVVIDLRNKKMKGIDNNLILNLSKIYNIRKLNLNFRNAISGCNLACELTNLFEYLDKIEFLSLDLSKNYISDEGLKLLSNNLSNLTNLKYLFLELSHNNIGDEGISYLSQAISNLTNLNTIDLNFLYRKLFHFDDEDNFLIDNTIKNTITNDGLSLFIISLQNLHNLITLRLCLTGNSITTKGIKIFSKLLPIKLINLDLYLGENQIKNEGLKDLVIGIKNLQKLERLSLFLECTGIDERSIDDVINNIYNKYSYLKIYLVENLIILNRKKLKNYYGDSVII